MNIMKKLLTLFLVLAIASNASAAIINFEILAASNPAGEYQGMPSYPDSTILTIGIVDPVGGVIMSISDMTILGPPTAQEPLVIDPAWNGGPVLNTPGFIQNDGTKLITGINMGMVMDFVSTYPGGTMYTFDYHVGGEYSDIITIDATIALSNTNDFTPVEFDGPLLIHVPEPITIALLGLGGLFLRRRK
jgi:hypothetical protein